MKAGKYTIKELFNNRHVEQIIIPEIQRDYVWSKKEVEGILSSIFESYEEYRQSVIIDNNWLENDEIKEAFELYYRKQKHSCNIGFIYAYNDPEYNGKYFLIDGQQRLTTIYLLLLTLASEKSEFRDKFIKLYTFNGLPKIDYRVREASRHILKELVENYSNKGIDIKNQPWFYSNYESDKTISSIISNIEVIKSFINDKILTNDDFINYVQDYIEFWYFDTNISEQGEELYIYMNARGEQMQENENLKADLLGRLTATDGNDLTLSEIKNNWGKKWEEWQQFFWINRKENLNADKGFNEFINCIAGLENYLGNHRTIYTKEDFENERRGKKNQIAYPDILSIFSNNGLKKISDYFDGLNYIFNEDNIAKFKKNYENISWIEKCLSEIHIILNSNHTNWFADIRDQNRGIEHSRMVFIWSILHYLETRDVISRQNTEIFRVLRLYYIRYKNYNRSVDSIKYDVNELNQLGPWKVERTMDEYQKNNWFCNKINAEEYRKYEELIWEIEDHPLNLDGSDVKAINCSHLIDFNKQPDLNELRHIKDRFYELFPLIKRTNNKVEFGKLNEKKLISILVFYGSFWERESPFYCWNFRFDNWKKIIRNINDNDLKPTPFNNFFEDFKQKSLEELYKERVFEFEIDRNTIDFAEQLKWYVSKLNESMWTQGHNIAFGHYNYPNKDQIFFNTNEILNTKGDFKGGNPQVLSKLLDKFKNPL